MVEQYKQQLDAMMQREISRVEFLKVVGVVLLGLVGITGFLKNLHEAVPGRTSGKNHSFRPGYGNSSYGR